MVTNYDFECIGKNKVRNENIASYSMDRNSAHAFFVFSIVNSVLAQLLNLLGYA